MLAYLQIDAKIRLSTVYDFYFNYFIKQLS